MTAKFFQMLQAAIALFRTNKEATINTLDVALTEHAFEIAEADRACQIARAAADKKLWDTLRSHWDQRVADQNEVDAKAGEFNDYAAKVYAWHQRMRVQAYEFGDNIDGPPAKPQPFIGVREEDMTKVDPSTASQAQAT